MITARIFRNEHGNISGFEISGHAGYAEAGSDIICSAVSAIAYTAVGYFDEKRYDGKAPSYSEEDGHMIFTAPEPKNKEETIEIGAVLDAAAIGLKQIELSYGKKYIRVID